MLRSQCCRSQLTTLLHSRRQLATWNQRRAASNSTSTGQDESLEKTSNGRPNSRSTQNEEAKHNDWSTFFKPESTGDDQSQAARDVGSGQSGSPEPAGLWTTLSSRMASSIKEGAIQKKDHGKFSKGTNKSSTEEMTASTSSPDVVQPKKGAKSKRSKTKAPLDVKTIRPAKLRLQPIEEQETRQAPQLCHNLDRVLFNPGVYHMQDHRSRVFNFEPHLTSIMPVEEFDFDALKEYTTSSKDSKLRELCAAHGLKYCGSTSSMTSILSHLHYLLSAWRRPNFDNLSKSLKLESTNFTALTRGPAAAFAHFQDGVHAIDADKEYDTESILSMLGKSMEKLLTLPKEEFEKYRRTQSHQLSEEEKNADEAYHFTTLGDFMMRSQLDAHDPRLPGSGVFDLKTRAVVSIRMDVMGYEKGVGYEIRERFGQWESFEREYYDMIRAAFLKYSLQVRMGRMDGIFVAFHNTQRIFGFQYISLAEMDQAIHGTHDTRLGDQEFKCSISLLNDLMNRASQRFPGRTLRLHVETRPTKVPLTYFFVEPVSEDEMKRTQEAGKPSVEQLEREIQSLSREERKAESAEEDERAVSEDLKTEDADKTLDEQANDPQGEDTWKEMMAKVDEAVESESLGIRSIREALEEALEQSGLLQDKTELESEKYLDDLVAALTTHSSEVKELRESHVTTEKDADASHQSGTDQLGTESTTLANLILKVTEGIDEESPNLTLFERKVVDLATQAKKTNATGSDEPDIKSSTDVNANVNADIKDADSGPEESRPAAIPPEEPQTELLGMYITIRNKVNGEFVERPTLPDGRFDWAMQYTVTELPDKRAQRIYAEIKKRRKDVLATNPRARSADWHRMFKGKLPIVTKQGAKFREERSRLEAGSPIYVAWNREPLPPSNLTRSD